jgi:hypothetical protein
VKKDTTLKDSVKEVGSGRRGGTAAIKREKVTPGDAEEEEPMVSSKGQTIKRTKR